MTELETREENEDEKPKTTKKKSTAKKSTKKSAEKKEEAKAAAPDPVDAEVETKATESPRGDHTDTHLPGPGPANRRKQV